MAGLYDTSVEVLGAIVGTLPAQMCMRGACVQIGKTGEALTDSDFDAVAAKIRADMCRFASPELIESALAKIRATL